MVLKTNPSWPALLSVWLSNGRLSRASAIIASAVNRSVNHGLDKRGNHSLSNASSSSSDFGVRIDASLSHVVQSVQTSEDVSAQDKQLRHNITAQSCLRTMKTVGTCLNWLNYSSVVIIIIMDTF